MAVEVSTSRSQGGNKRENDGETLPEGQSNEDSESSDLSERDLFVPIKKAPKKSKKSEDCLSSVVELIKKVVDNDPTKD